MSDYNEELARQTAIFDQWLKLMVQRRLHEEERDCAITFKENPPDGFPAAKLEASRALALPNAQAARDEPGSGDFLDQNIVRIPIDKAEAGGGKGVAGPDRFIQFAFVNRTFYMDLPNTTLWPDEAKRLMSRRHGFFHARDRRFPWHSVDYWKYIVKSWNPVQKEYLNSDTCTAAEDMAFILYDLWRFPLDWRFYYHALVFNRKQKRDWEGEGPVG